MKTRILPNKSITMVITIILLLTVSISGCLEEGGDVVPPREVAYVETGFAIEPRLVWDTYLWDIVLPITNVTFENVLPRWDDSSLTIDKYGRWFEVENLPLEPRPLLPPTEPTFYYIETSGSEDRPDPGDTIVIGALDRSHQGADLRFRPGSFDLLMETRVPIWNETYSMALEQPRFINPIHIPFASKWDMVVEIASIEPEWEKVGWDTLRYVQYGSADEDVRLEPYPGDGPVDRESVGFWYFENGTEDGFVSPDDQILITGASHKLGGDREWIMTGKATVARFELPGRLPYTGGSCMLSEPSLTSYTIENSVYTEAAYTVIDVNATEGPIPLTQVWISVDMLGGGEFSVFNMPRHHLVTTLIAWGQDTDDSGTITIGDVFFVTGLTQFHVGRSVTIVRWEMAVAHNRLPLIVYDSTGAIGFEKPVVTMENTTQGIRFVAGYQVEDLHPRDVEIPWTEMTVKVMDADDMTMLVPRFNVSTVPHPKNDTLNVWLSKGDDTSENLAMGDTIWVQCINRSLLSAIMRLELDGMSLCHILLPVHAEGLDASNFQWGLAHSQIAYGPRDGDPRWNVLLRFHNTTVGGDEVELNEVSIELVSWNGSLREGPYPLQPFPPDGIEGWDGFYTGALTFWRLDTGSEAVDPKWVNGIGLNGISEDHAGMKVRLLVGTRHQIVYEYVLPGTLMTD